MIESENILSGFE